VQTFPYLQSDIVGLLTLPCAVLLTFYYFFSLIGCLTVKAEENFQTRGFRWILTPNFPPFNDRDMIGSQQFHLHVPRSL
jgi:hypothetical protein